MATRLDSRSLKLFLAVARTLNFRQAAESLHLSQPPLSRAIREFEARLGTPLFERDTQGVALTPAGRALLPFARRMERLLDDAEAALAGLRAPAPRPHRGGASGSRGVAVGLVAAPGTPDPGRPAGRGAGRHAGRRART